MIPPAGIYAARGVMRSGTFDGALHLGPRPAFKGSAPSVELFLMDFDADIYGEEVRVDFVEYLRPVLPFDSVADLVVQIGSDVVKARGVLTIDENARP